MFGVFPAALLCYFFRRDPQLAARRRQRREQRPEQKLWQALRTPLWLALFVLPGSNHRFGWSRTLLAEVPPWLSVLGRGLVFCSWVLIFEAFRDNAFAAVIQVEPGQRVVSEGPYRVVRHLMYSVAVLMVSAVPLAPGSCVALPLAAPLIALLVFRLLNEERFLVTALPGNAEYCQHASFRLIPFAW